MLFKVFQGLCPANISSIWSCSLQINKLFRQVIIPYTIYDSILSCATNNKLSTSHFPLLKFLQLHKNSQLQLGLRDLYLLFWMPSKDKYPFCQVRPGLAQWCFSFNYHLKCTWEGLLVSLWFPPCGCTNLFACPQMRWVHVPLYLNRVPIPGRRRKSTYL